MLRSRASGERLFQSWHASGDASWPGAVNQDFRGSAEAANAFLKLLRRRSRVGHVLRLCMKSGSGRYLPEFGRISM